MNAIVAADKNWAIGYKNKLLVSIPADRLESFPASFFPSQLPFQTVCR